MKKTLKTLATLLTGTMIALATVSCDDGNTPGKTDGDGEIITLPSEVKSAMTLDKGSYKLDRPLLVKSGASLTIPAGTVIEAEPGFNSYILVERGGKIFVNGTAEKPVIMTSTTKQPGAWGGLIINGYAELTKSQPEAATEINSVFPYGPGKGNAPKNNDNSGSIKYLIIEYPGANMNDDTEHNGLTLNGVGSGTTIENVFVYKSADDAIEFFGGRANVTNFLSVDADDDMFDFTQGYSGTLKNAYGIWNEGHKSTESDPRGVEADGNHDGQFPTDANQSNFVIDNVTIELNQSPKKDDGYYMHDVFKIRRGATAVIKNALVKGQGQAKDLIDTTDGKGHGMLTINYNIRLTTPLSGKETNTPAGIESVSATKDSSTGTSSSIFGWTGYDFGGMKYTSKVK